MSKNVCIWDMGCSRATTTLGSRSFCPVTFAVGIECEELDQEVTSCSFSKLSLEGPTSGSTHSVIFASDVLQVPALMSTPSQLFSIVHLLREARN